MFNNKKIIFFIMLIALILGTILLNRSFGYEVDELKENSILVGNDVYEGYVSPNKIIKSAINYYEETGTEDNYIYKYNGKEADGNLIWKVLTADGTYSKLSSIGVDELEIRRYMSNALDAIKKLSLEELEEKATRKYNDEYYFFETDIEKLGIYSTDDIKGFLTYKEGKLLNYNFQIGNYKKENYTNSKTLKVIKVEDYRYEDGKELSDTETIKKAINQIKENNGGMLLFASEKVYNVELYTVYEIIEKSGLNLDDIKNGDYKSNRSLYSKMSANKKLFSFSSISGTVIVDLNNSELKLKENLYAGYVMISLNAVDNFVLMNGKLTGDVETHKYSGPGSLEEIYGYINPTTNKNEFYDNLKSNAWGFGISSANSDIILDNMDIGSLTGDGMYLKDNGSEIQTSIIKLYNSKFHNNRRMGLTIEDVGKVYLENSHIYEIGNYIDDDGKEHTQGDGGVSPEAGIDVECEKGYYPTKFLSINNSIIEKAGVSGIVSGSSESTIQILDTNTEDTNEKNRKEIKRLLELDEKGEDKSSLTILEKVMNEDNTEVIKLKYRYYYLMDAKITNSIMGERVIIPNTYFNNTIFKTNIPSISYNFSNSNIENSELYGKVNLDDNGGTILKLTNTNIKNSNIEDFHGWYYDPKNGQAPYRGNHLYTGIKYETTLKDNLNNNYFKNNWITVLTGTGPINFKNSVFEDNTFNLWDYNSSSIIRNINIDNTTMINNNYLHVHIRPVVYNTLYININNSNITNSLFDEFKNTIINSTVTLIDEEKYLEQIFKNKTNESEFDNSTLILDYNIKNQNILKENLAFKNNSKIIFKLYSKDDFIESDDICKNNNCQVCYGAECN